MTKIRRALIKDLDAINELTIEMHNYLGALVGIKFSRKELKEAMYGNEQNLENMYVAESDGKVVGYMSFPIRLMKTSFSANIIPYTT
jgi:ribosomal protein S18 acetylase RimI-like enzyme